MRVLIGCEYSNTVSQAFRDMGHDTYSCDYEPSEGPAKWHYRMNIFEALHTLPRWDLIILHPPCTALAVCGNGTYAPNGVMSSERLAAIEWTIGLWQEAEELCGKVALENPVGVLSSNWSKPDQYIQPWQFGHGETKKTGLWLRGLPKLKPTNIVNGREQRVWKMGPSPDRGKERSRFYPGIAKAMAEQWGG